LKTRIFLIRHGETLWNREQRCQGFTDIELSDKGVEQAHRLARHLGKTAKLSAVYSSDLSRARKTAEIIAEEQKLVVRTDPRLREMNQGKIEGNKLYEMLAHYPALLEHWMKEPADAVMPDGESITQLQTRAWQAFEEIIELHKDETIAVVAHNLCNTMILCKILDLDLNKFRRIKQSSACLNEIEIGSIGPVIMHLNDTHFLD
jgi:broad specificity phosphatase PhoE